MIISQIASARPHLPGTEIGVYPNSSSSTNTSLYPWIDAYRCNGCAACIRACPPGIIGLVNGKAAIVYDFCQQCGECFDSCPVEGAIIFRLRPGAPQSNNTPYFSRM